MSYEVIKSFIREKTTNHMEGKLWKCLKYIFIYYKNGEQRKKGKILTLPDPKGQWESWKMSILCHFSPMGIIKKNANPMPLLIFMWEKIISMYKNNKKT